MKCFACHFADRLGTKHCFGTNVAANDPTTSCQCECKEHTIAPNDIRMNLIEIMTAGAHDDMDLLKSLIVTYDEDQIKVLLLLCVQLHIWMLRQLGQDPVATMQKAALYWQGGEPGDDSETEDDNGGD